MSLVGASRAALGLPLPQAAIACAAGPGWTALGHWGCQLLAGPLRHTLHSQKVLDPEGLITHDRLSS